MREENIAKTHLEALELMPNRFNDLLCDKIASSFSGFELEMFLIPGHAKLSILIIIEA